MQLFMNIIHILFPLLGILLIIIGIKTAKKQYISLALWLSLIALIIHYRTSGGEILGVYFDYLHTLIYSLNLLILLTCILYLLLSYTSGSEKTWVRYSSSGIAAIAVVSTVILLMNLWINAVFIENRFPGTPLLQVANLNKLDYCNYWYTFYKVDKKGNVVYLCPNYYGLIPATGRLDNVPAAIANQLPRQVQATINQNK